jgi:O-antigen ligase
MELFFCMCVGALLDRRPIGGFLRVFTFFAALVAIAGIILTQSRGAGMTLGVIVAGILLWGFTQWPRPFRWYWRLITVCLLLLVLIGGLAAHPDYVKRFTTYGNLHKAGEGGDRTVVQDVIFKLKRTSRGRMYGGAWRAWQTAPWLGIGPGMHQHRWPEFAATQDGDREKGSWPTLTNHHFHSYEVHSDWLQLLEEYGIVGLLLFYMPLGFLGWVFMRRSRRERVLWKQGGNRLKHATGFAYVLAGGLALLAMTFHSLGDFNLQMPGTVWMLALLVANGMGEMDDVDTDDVDE